LVADQQNVRIGGRVTFQLLQDDRCIFGFGVLDASFCPIVVFELGSLYSTLPAEDGVGLISLIWVRENGRRHWVADCVASWPRMPVGIRRSMSMTAVDS